jgi:hypothetical protein
MLRALSSLSVCGKNVLHLCTPVAHGGAILEATRSKNPYQLKGRRAADDEMSAHGDIVDKL